MRPGSQERRSALRCFCSPGQLSTPISYACSYPRAIFRFADHESPVPLAIDGLPPAVPASKKASSQDPVGRRSQYVPFGKAVQLTRRSQAQFRWPERGAQHAASFLRGLFSSNCSRNWTASHAQARIAGVKIGVRDVVCIEAQRAVAPSASRRRRRPGDPAETRKPDAPQCFPHANSAPPAALKASKFRTPVHRILDCIFSARASMPHRPYAPCHRKARSVFV